MGAPPFDFDELFDDDYLYFYETLTDADCCDREAALIAGLLHLESGARVLDLACGYGRIANALAARDYDVTGLDRSPTLLARAQRDASASRLTTSLVQGDMRSLPWAASFDAVFCWFTSFGYFADSDLRRVLAEIHRALIPGGRALIECLNRDAMLAEFQDSFVVHRGDDVMVDDNRWDPITGRTLHERTVIRAGKWRRLRFFVRQFTFTELRDWLHQAGFVRVNGYGADGEVFGITSDRMIVVAEASRTKSDNAPGTAPDLRESRDSPSPRP